MRIIVKRVMKLIEHIPIVGNVCSWIYYKFLARRFSGSEKYWIDRYSKRENSGVASYGLLAEFKAAILNDFVKEHNVKSVIEYGCGDGNQLRFAEYPDYLGFDVSPIALSQCREIFHNDKTKCFKSMDEFAEETAELTLSLDVIYHLIEDEVFESYMRRLFDSSTGFVIVYSSNRDKQDTIQAPHVKHRKFTIWMDENIRGWKLIQYIPNEYPHAGDRFVGDFFIYKKV